MAHQWNLHQKQSRQLQKLQPNHVAIEENDLGGLFKKRPDSDGHSQVNVAGDLSAKDLIGSWLSLIAPVQYRWRWKDWSIWLDCCRLLEGYDILLNGREYFEALKALDSRADSEMRVLLCKCRNHYEAHRHLDISAALMRPEGISYSSEVLSPGICSGEEGKPPALSLKRVHYYAQAERKLHVLHQFGSESARSSKSRYNIVQIRR
ncbi:hypothetical protein OE88DRAFT_1641164 [Heliocybe sulcata]|uniref:Uncharacterized protein n=1 Tax=Heliocybe sulcata TaxID=5364 RepID=A0A5C3NJH0_9AGAM|nr:hypothetical protein OE88DRAFT_1641164 [Heliocybe sulcata]